MNPTVGVVILTTGERDNLLRALLKTIENQIDQPDQIVVIWNGAEPDLAVAGVRHVGFDTNLGIPAGRNRGAKMSKNEIILFLDDDASLSSENIIGEIRQHFQGDQHVAAVALRLKDPVTGQTLRRWIPRLGRDGDTPGKVTRFPGGAVAIGKEPMRAAGWYREDFIYGHEESDLAMRLLDLSYRIDYRPDLVVHHPAHTTEFDAERVRLLARNRVWMALLRLPWPVAVPNILIWPIISTVRARSIGDVTESWKGWILGLTCPPSGRNPISWRTVWKMTRLGHPPFV